MGFEHLQIDDELRIQLKYIIDEEFKTKAVITIDNYNEDRGFLSDCLLLKIHDKTKQLNLFVKACIKKGPYSKLTIARKTFQNELWYYNKIFPAYSEFELEKREINLSLNISKCYGTNLTEGNEFIILENLRSQGFKLYRERTMNDEHLLLVFKTMANYHAVAYALKDQKPQVYRELSEGLSELFFGNMLETGFDKAVKANLNNYFESCGNEKFSNEVDRLKKGIMDGLYDSKYWMEDDRHSIITQADFWINNIMFKYENDRPVQIKIIDFQFIRMNSPVCELSLFFYTLATKEQMRNFRLYLNAYHKTLSDRMRRLGSDAETVYPYDIFREHWKRFSRYGFSVGLIFLKLMLADKHEIIDVTEVLKHSRDMSLTFSFSSRNDFLYNHHISDVFDHFIENEFV